MSTQLSALIMIQASQRLIWIPFKIVIWCIKSGRPETHSC